eukprot:CAMPEP_0194291160 /NCGR_PEP_ID=MMETSP0169-20130528/42873_1 /TAXON_ID=218684 /ORGANISM="Corethron pennatum, Strain L29A3" /LENGTH=400 /DNA_ID=CAMNT_0039038963 /DNA_START=165 /DNA_END=1368 /DNA_ORIENTATION=+
MRRSREADDEATQRAAAVRVPVPGARAFFLDVTDDGVRGLPPGHHRETSAAQQQYRRGIVADGLVEAGGFVETTALVAKALTSSRVLSEDYATLSDYAPEAFALFNNMKLPAGVLTAGMIAIGFATRFPELPRDTPDRVYSPEIRSRCDQLDRLHIVVALISVTSELIVVLWSAVSVNQLTERTFAPAYSVWDLIRRDCDLPWSGINSHFIIGIIGFITMLWLRAYVMLLTAKASRFLMGAASSGTGAALCLCVSIVNRGVEAGGGGGNRYGSTILDLFQHYIELLLQFSIDLDSPGPLQLSAVVLESTSLFCLLAVLLTENDAAKYEARKKDEWCDLTFFDTLVKNGDGMENMSAQDLDQLKSCLALEEEDRRRQENPSLEEEEEEKKRQVDDSNSGVV